MRMVDLNHLIKSVVKIESANRAGMTATRFSFTAETIKDSMSKHKERKTKTILPASCAKNNMKKKMNFS